jgi:hypothetical protein
LAVFPSLLTTKMPLQCVLGWKIFQVAVVDVTGKKWLLDKCRPKRCPYCGDFDTYKGHCYEPRYIILPSLITVSLTVPRYKCAACGHTIRVLPFELHNHCNHISETIHDLITSKLEAGRYLNKKALPKYLQRHWYNLYVKRCQDYLNLSAEMDVKTCIKRLPVFSVLYRSKYLSVGASAPAVLWSSTHAILPLIVFLDSS